MIQNALTFNQCDSITFRIYSMREWVPWVHVVKLFLGNISSKVLEWMIMNTYISFAYSSDATQQQFMIQINTKWFIMNMNDILWYLISCKIYKSLNRARISCKYSKDKSKPQMHHSKQKPNALIRDCSRWMWVQEETLNLSMNDIQTHFSVIFMSTKELKPHTICGSLPVSLIYSASLPP